MLLRALSVSLAAATALAQGEIEYTTITAGGQTTSVAMPRSFLKPTGVVRGSYSFGSSTPMICHSVCFSKQSYYALCVLGTQVEDISSGEAVEVPQERCLDELCTEGAYNHIYECLNCIVANGGERTSSTGSFSTIPEATTSSRFADPTMPQWPSIDAQAANGWLSNITEYCQAGGREVRGESSVTASPTTTGPYTTRYSDGETVDIPQWTQLATLSQMISGFDATQRDAYVSTITAELAAQASQTGAAGRAGPSFVQLMLCGGLAAVMGVLASCRF